MAVTKARAAKHMLVHRVSLNKLIGARYNPKSRTEDIGGLVQSIERVGLLVPILITKENHVIEGHRRIAACKKLGHTTIPTLVAAGDQAEMFSEINTAYRNFTGNQVLEIYLKEPKAVSPNARTKVQGLENLVGRATLQRMCDNGFSTGTYDMARRVARYCDIEDDEKLVAILKWLMKFRSVFVVRQAMAASTQPSRIMAAVNNKKPLRVSFGSMK